VGNGSENKGHDLLGNDEGRTSIAAQGHDVRIRAQLTLGYLLMVGFVALAELCRVLEYAGVVEALAALQERSAA
jgi:hypothetical protein